MVNYVWVSTIFLLQRVKSRFSVEIFLSHSAENFVGEPISVSLFLGIDNFFASEG